MTNATDLTAHDLTLSYLALHDGGTASDLLAYLWEQQDKVTSRSYFYHIIRRLRNRGWITTRHKSVPGKAFHTITPLGMQNVIEKWRAGEL